MNTRNSGDCPDVDKVMPTSDLLDALLAGVATAPADAAVAAFCADLRAQFGAESAVADTATVQWVARPDRKTARVAALKTWVATAIGALTFAFGGMAASGALPGPLQHSVAKAAHRIGLGFIPDGGSADHGPIRGEHLPPPRQGPGPATTSGPPTNEPTHGVEPQTQTTIPTPPASHDTATTTPRNPTPVENDEPGSGDDEHHESPDDEGHPTSTTSEAEDPPQVDPDDPDDPLNEHDGSDNNKSDETEPPDSSDSHDSTDEKDSTGD